MKLSKEQVHEFWQNPKDQNSPERYLDYDHTLKRSEFLVGKIKKNFKPKTTKILELGCNVGRNLNALFGEKYKKLTGIEINTNALEILVKTYTEMSLRTTLINGSFEDVLPTIPTGGVDVIFTLAVLMHVHPESEFIFNEMKRIAKKGIITIEYENNMGGNPIERIEKRNYKAIFEGDGWKQQEEEPVGNQCDPAMIYYTYRLFTKEG